MSINAIEVQCPFCREVIRIESDPLKDKQSYVKNCSACFRTIQITASSENTWNAIEKKQSETPGGGKSLLWMYVAVSLGAFIMGMVETSSHNGMMSAGYMIVFVLGSPWTWLLLHAPYAIFWVGPLILNAAIIWFFTGRAKNAKTDEGVRWKGSDT